MAWLVVVDEESMELLDGAAEMAAAALAARSRRVDEDGVLKRSSDMSRIKLATLRASMHTSPLGKYSELSDRDKREFEALLHAFLGTGEEAKHDAIWQTFRAYLLRPGNEKPFSGGSEPWGDEDLRKPRVAENTATMQAGEAAVRDMLKKRGKRGAPQKAAQ